MKTVNFDDLPLTVQRHFIECIQQNSDITPEEAKNIWWQRMSSMSPEEVFDRYLKYIGIIGFTQQILEAWHGIREASNDTPF